MDVQYLIQQILIQSLDRDNNESLTSCYIIINLAVYFSILHHFVAYEKVQGRYYYIFLRARWL